MKLITRKVWILSLVSLFTDIASEMLYPIMPVYLSSVGFSVLMIGLFEGFAEAVTGFSKGYFGKLSDASGKRVPFVQWGYGMSALSKPLMGLLVYPWWILMARTMDRLGKGLRTGARDALLSDEATPETKARVFGFHRSMDTLGAAIGPFFALIYLYFYPADYATLFLIAFLPGVMAVLATSLLREQPRKGDIKKEFPRVRFFSFLNFWKSSPAPYRRLTMGLLFFTLFNGSDTFLLLKMKETGMDDTTLVGTYMFYNLIYAFMAYPLGIFADRIGMRKIFILGLCFFALTYVGFSLNQIPWLFFVFFFLYGLYAACTEGISKAWISNLVSNDETATAIGTYAAFQSVCTLFASFITGLVWFQFGSFWALGMTASAGMITIFYFLVLAPAPELKK